MSAGGHSSAAAATLRKGARVIRPLSPDDAMSFPDNTVTNSRYTIYNFIFLNIYEQFTRPLNFYFLLVACLQFFSIIAPVNPMSTLLPLLFAFSLTALKEGYDDVKRHRQDREYNEKQRCVLNPFTGLWSYRPNSSLRVGDVVMLCENEEVPCDLVPVAASARTVYIRTDNLDGEIDLKPREVATAVVTTVADGAEQQTPMISIDDGVPELTVRLSRVLLHCPPPSAMIEEFNGRAEFYVENTEDVVQVSLSHHHLLPQSCVVKNTERVIGVVVYTGDDTKLGMNKNPAPVKWAQIDKLVSKYSVYIFCCQMLNAVVFGMVGYVTNRTAHEKFWYLPASAAESSAALAIYPLRFFLLTTVMIPVSFKFVVDVSKYYMALTVEWDASMQHPDPAAHAPAAGSSLVGCKVKNSSILEDLGQISYVLSDKTGTMTKNEMEVLHVSIEPSYHVDVAPLLLPLFVSTTYPAENRGLHTLSQILSDTSAVSSSSTQQQQQAAVSTATRFFATVLALCNAVEVSHSVEVQGQLLYLGASPDEVALCKAAAKMDVVLEGRTEERIDICVGGTVHESWRLLHVLPFSSDRKAMGVIVESPTTRQTHLLVKGADDSVRRMLDASAPLSPFIEGELKAYASRGLRTLVVAHRVLTPHVLSAFLSATQQATLQTTGRFERLSELRDGLETGLQPLGITAIEDKLQDNVYDTVNAFLTAGIRVWMLTGDKVETAEQIGLSCGLYEPGDQVIRIVENDQYDWEEYLLTRADPVVHEAFSASPADAATNNAATSTTAAIAGECLVQSTLRYQRGADASRDSGVPATVRPPPTEVSGSSASRSDASGGDSSMSRRRRSSVLLLQGGAVLHKVLNTADLRQRFLTIASQCCSVICARTTPSQKALLAGLVRAAGNITLGVGDGGNDVELLQEAHVGVGIMGKEGSQAARAADYAVVQFSDLRSLVFVHGQQAYARTAYVIKYSFYKSMLISFIQLAFNVVGTYYSGGTFWNSFSLTMWNGVYTLPQTIFYCFDRCAPRVVLERVPALYKLTKSGADMQPVEFFVTYVLRGVVQSVVLLFFATSVFGPAFAYAGSGGNASIDVTFSSAYTALMVSQIFTIFFESHSVTWLNVWALFGMPVFYVVSTLAFSNVPTLQYYGVFKKSLEAGPLLASIGIAMLLFVPCAVMVVLRDTLYGNPRDLLADAERRRQRQTSWRPPRHSCFDKLMSFCRFGPEAPSALLSAVPGERHGAGSPTAAAAPGTTAFPSTISV